MSSPLLHLGVPLTCSHGGSAHVTQTNSRVLVGGQPVVTLPGACVITGCPLPPAHGASGCRTGHFITASSRVTVMGQLLVLQDSLSICEPTGTPLLILAGQSRVLAS